MAYTAKELSDIKTQFYALMENYPTVYANYKVNPDLPSAADAYNKLEANLTSLYRRMFVFQSGLENEIDERETTVNDLTNKNVKLNAILAKKTAALDRKDALMTTNTTVYESFTTMSGLPQLPGCIFDASGNPPTNCPCVDSTASCPASCKESCPATTNQISMVAEAKSIEKTTYLYSILRIIYLLLGIGLISFFIYKMVGPQATSAATSAATNNKPSLDSFNSSNKQL
jgi:hypothetical protein